MSGSLFFGAPKGGWVIGKKKKGVVYCAGPMTGWPNHNFPWFHTAEKNLRAAGYDTINPATHDNEKGFDGTGIPDDPRFRNKALAWDLQKICLKATHIAVHPQWRTSSGAKAEWAAAKAVGLKVIHMTEEGELA